VRLLISFIVNAAALYVVTLCNIGVHADTVTALLIAALVFGIANAIVRPILLLLSLPFIVITLGLFVFLVNGFVLWLTGKVVPGFHVDTFWAGVLGAIILGAVSWVINWVGMKAEKASA